MEGTWRKSSYSQGADNCVELTWDKRGLLTRDSKARSGATLSFAAAATKAWLAAVKAGEFDR